MPLPTTTLHGRFALRAAAAPDCPAVVDRGGTLSYAELDARSERLAASLRGIGVGPDVRSGAV